LGTEGRLVMAYAKLINEMWNESDQVVRPDLFKRILGEYAQQFSGYGQHDSHECINTVLDLMGEDLYRKGKKPFVEDTESDGKSQEDVAEEAWNKHLLRNESIITDLFHGQFKSTVCCQKCDRVSVTFDPMMTMLLPIPVPKKEYKMFYIPYNIQAGYVNKSADIKLRTTDSLTSFREDFESIFKVDKGNYIITKVQENEFVRWFGANQSIGNLIEENGVTVLYEVNPELHPQLPDMATSDDNNHGIDIERYVRCVLNIKQYQKSAHSSRLGQNGMLPRIIWLERSWTLKQAHEYVFHFLKEVLADWVDWKDPNTEKKPKSGSGEDLRKELIDFPYRPSGMSTQQAFSKK
jgi:Ubiquitin carboxyl-terminal hydrolase